MKPNLNALSERLLIQLAELRDEAHPKDQQMVDEIVTDMRNLHAAIVAQQDPIPKGSRNQ